MRKLFNFQVESLKSICADYTAKNLVKIVTFDEENFKYLPDNIKDHLLNKTLVSEHFWRNVNVKKVLPFLIHKRIQKLDLSNITIDDELLKIIGNCNELSELDLTFISQHSLTAEAIINFFTKMHELSVVRLSHCDLVDDKVLDIILKNNRKLKCLDIGGCKNLTDKSLIHLAEMPMIRHLNLSETRISNQGLENILNGSSKEKIVELKISNCPNLTENVLKTVTESCVSLQILVFFNNNMDQFGENLESDKLKKLKQLTWTISW